MLHRICLLLTQSGHERLRIAAVQLASQPHFAGRKSLSGGLLSYGADLRDNFRRAAHYVDRVLKGEKPADLPVQAPTKFELVINLKTAKELGLTITRDFLLIADEVIE